MSPVPVVEMMSLRDDLLREHPGFELLAAEDPSAVERLLRRLGWLQPNESFRGCEIAGEGNMNLTLRVKTSARTLVLKQSRPWVEKYPQIAAPFDRALVEQRFYRRVAAIPEVAGRMPELLAADPETRTLLLEDLGAAQDLSELYRRGELAVFEVRELGAYLRALHGATAGQDPQGLENREMRALNWEHIFRVPYLADSGVSLEDYEPGLSEAAARLRSGQGLRSKIEALGERYLEDGPCLLHGDYFPGSWLRTDRGLRVIDPEFCFYGDPELDLGVAIAHFVLSRQFFGLDEELIDAAVDPRPDLVVREALVAQYAGAEVIRRLIGLAQLPIPPTSGFRANMLDRARVAIEEETLEAFRT